MGGAHTSLLVRRLLLDRMHRSSVEKAFTLGTGPRWHQPTRGPTCPST
jgi:hypothetical protein